MDDLVNDEAPRETVLVTQEANIPTLVKDTPYAALPQRDFYRLVSRSPKIAPPRGCRTPAIIAVQPGALA
jgi:hypothetical protein